MMDDRTDAGPFIDHVERLKVLKAEGGHPRDTGALDDEAKLADNQATIRRIYALASVTKGEEAQIVYAAEKTAALAIQDALDGGLLGSIDGLATLLMTLWEDGVATGATYVATRP